MKGLLARSCIGCQDETSVKDVSAFGLHAGLSSVLLGSSAEPEP